MARGRLKRRITHGGASELIPPPREAISLWGQSRVCPLFRDKVVEMQRDKTQCAEGQAARSHDLLLRWLCHTLRKATALHFKE